MPVVISLLAMNPTLLALLGSRASVNRVIITIDEATGNYILQFNIISPQDLTDGSSLFLHYIMDNKIPIAMGVPGKWEQHGSQWKYLESGSYLKHTWRKIEGLWYYFHSDGVMASRQWIKTGGKWYFTRSKGNMAIDQWIEDGKKWYYVGRDGVTDSMVDELNRVLHKYEINNTERIRYFLAQAQHESGNGKILIERYNGNSPEEYFRNRDFRPEYEHNQTGDGAKYRGGGYMQLTWKATYRGFSEYMDDNRIVKDGTSYVANNYAWE